MSAHTPGPWRDEGFTVQTSDGTIVADCCTRNPINGLGPAPEYEANARLIANAPLMLAALEKMSELFSAEENADPTFLQPHGCNLHAGMALVRAAIEKARSS